QAEDGIRDRNVTGVQTCALPIYMPASLNAGGEARRSATGEARSARTADRGRRDMRIPSALGLEQHERRAVRTFEQRTARAVCGRSEERRVGKECRSRGGRAP